MGNDEMHVEGAAKATNKTVVSSRFDSSGFKKEYPDLFTEYSRETSYKRFCVL
jgi:predicted phage-related endonuclease